MRFREIIAFEKLMRSATDGDNTPTPHGLCQYLYDLIWPHYQPQVGLDPCAGLDNRMSQPWKETTWINFEKRAKKDFDDQKEVLPDVEMVLCNPPFSGGKARKFTLRIFEVVPEGTPAVVVHSALYLYGNYTHTSDYDWLLSKPPITSFVFLPRNGFPGVSHPAVILLFNMPKLEPCYTVPYDYLGW